MSDSRVPADLRAAVRSELRPVRPLAPPVTRAMALLPLGLLLLVAGPAFWGWRSNLAALGTAASWGLSMFQVLGGLLIVGAALREAIPGRQLSAPAVAATVAAALALFVGITFLTSALLPTVVRPGLWARYAWECFGMAATTGIPVLAAAAWLASRALPTRPAVAGAIYGLGAGLIADAGARLFCWISTPSHVLLAHGGAILLLTIFGAIFGAAAERFPRRRTGGSRSEDRLHR